VAEGAAMRSLLGFLIGLAAYFWLVWKYVGPF
jgi:hypothetical protein